MTHPMDDSVRPQPKVEGSQGEHTQESGEGGLSFVIAHGPNIDFGEEVSHAADKRSYVRPIPKEERGFTSGPVWEER
ncbi:hypothetical protein INR49_001467 [Caranx melampygus]|nr:hypothetical protein INR49_001467 [Caranx melampygus]